MKKNLWLLAIAQGLFLTNNVVFIAINGLVGLMLAPVAWMATLPVMGYVVGGAMSTGLVAASQRRWGRQVSFQLGLLVAFLTALLCAFALEIGSFWLLVAGTVIAGYYSANGQLYRFAAGELAEPSFREKAVSLVLAGGLIGAVVGPNLANYTRDSFTAPFLGSYLALAVVALVSMGVMSGIRFAAEPVRAIGSSLGRPIGEIMRQPVFLVATIGAALGYGVMNLLMAATPLAMDACGMPFSDAALVLEWHVIGMFAPGFFTGHLIKRFGVLSIMGVGVALNGVCIAIALSGQDLHQFLVALFLLGVGWNFLFTGSTTLAMQAYRPEEKDRAQAAINFAVFATMAVTAFASGALVTTQGWAWLNLGSIVPVAVMGASLIWLAQRQRADAVKVSAD
jgi:MFS family permease